jgi:K+-transporting ATPase ATPase B chain
MDTAFDSGETISGAHPSPELPRSPRRFKPKRLLEKETAYAALKQGFIMLRPDLQWNNPVMFVVEIGAFLYHTDGME